MFVYAGHGHGKKIKSGSFNPMGSVLSEMLLDKKIVSIDQISFMSRIGQDQNYLKELRKEWESLEPNFLIIENSNEYFT